MTSTARATHPKPTPPSTAPSGAPTASAPYIAIPAQDMARPAWCGPTAVTIQVLQAVVNRLSPKPSTMRPSSSTASAGPGGKTEASR